MNLLHAGLLTGRAPLLPCQCRSPLPLPTHPSMNLLHTVVQGADGRAAHGAAQPAPKGSLQVHMKQVHAIKNRQATGTAGEGGAAVPAARV